MSNIWIEIESTNQIIEVTGFTYDKQLFGNKYSFTVYCAEISMTIKSNITEEEAKYEYDLWKSWIAEGKYHLIQIEKEQ